MIEISVDDWNVLTQDGSEPSIFKYYLESAEFVDQIDIDNDEGRFLFLGISKDVNCKGRPSVVIAQKYQDERGTFTPGFLLVSDTSLFFLGAGERLLCYDIEKKVRLWEDRTTYGFWSWSRSGPYVLMSAEVEFGVWDTSGKKLWSTWVEPPWSFKIQGQAVALEVMGEIQNLRLSDGTNLD